MMVVLSWQAVLETGASDGDAHEQRFIRVGLTDGDELRRQLPHAVTRR